MFRGLNFSYFLWHVNYDGFAYQGSLELFDWSSFHIQLYSSLIIYVNGVNKVLQKNKYMII